MGQRREFSSGIAASGTFTGGERVEIRRGSTIGADSQLSVLPVNCWAFVGAVILAFMAYVIARWATGPYFQHVKPGPTPLPGWMKVSVVGWQILMPAIWLVMVWRFLVRPWRAERRLTVNGLFLIAATTGVFQDSMSNYFNPWITYNAYAVNWGSWYNDVPGWMAYGAPRHCLPMPVLFIPFCWGFAYLAWPMMGAAVMRAARRRWPAIGIPGLLAVVYVFMVVVDLVAEGLIWMPMGLFTYAGGHEPALFPRRVSPHALERGGPGRRVVHLRDVSLLLQKRQGPNLG
jgi:Spirocyclase AveC-like